MRFDDSLRTVLAADTTSAFGAQSAFRQLVDLIGRRRVPGRGEPIARLRRLRGQVPAAIRAASARALALADPPVELVTFFAEDEPAIAAPVLRSARLSDAEWLQLLPRLGPTGRGVLRARESLSPAVTRGLETFGTADFTLEHDGAQTRTDVVAPAAAATARDRDDAPPLRSVDPETAAVDPVSPRATGQTFAIADLVQRIDDFQRVRDDQGEARSARADRFEFETDVHGVISWVDGIPRAGLVGRALDPSGSRSQILRIGGIGEAAGNWILSQVAVYAADSGRLVGYRGIARRVANEASPAIDPDAMRRLVHELRTPTNAIAGFAELIGTELLGPVPAVHRDRAGAIGRDVAALIAAIEDLEVSARVDSGVLDLRPRPVEIVPALTAALRSVGAEDRIAIVAEPGLSVSADDLALERLLARLAGALAPPGSAEGPQTIRVRVMLGEVVVIWPWPAQPSESSLLGADFALRLADKLARALGGQLVTAPGSLTLRLPASLNTLVLAATL